MRTLLSRTIRFVRDRRAVAAIEFALIAPMLVIILFGAIEINDLMSANRRMENTAASIADVISRDTEVTDAEISDLWKAATALMFPHDPETLKMRVTSVQIVDANTTKVLWSDGYNGLDGRDEGSSIALPDSLMIPNTTVLLGETEFSYEPFIGVVLGVDIALDHAEYRRPRMQDKVDRK
jgi:Flp pilus assembly pilin Flp